MWYNNFILIENKSCYVKHLAVHGIVKIEDLKSDNGRFLESDKLLQARLSPVHFFNWLMDIVNSIPNESVEAYYLRHIYPSSNDTFEINIEKVTVNVWKFSTSRIRLQWI